MKPLPASPPRRWGWSAIALLFAPAAWAAGELDAVNEYQIKAAYLFNFSQFIDWPEPAFADAAQPFRLCVWGDSPFGDSLLALQSRRYKQRPIKIEFPTTLDQAGDCQILYLSGSEAQVRARAQQVASLPVLTVASNEGFARGGGAMEFVISGGRVRMTINLQIARAAGLKVSAKLLEVALRVIDPQPKGGAT